MGSTRYYFQPLLQVAAIACLLAGGVWMGAIPLLVIVSISLVDELLPDYEARERSPRFEDVPLYLAAALIFIIVAIYVAIAGQSFGFGPELLESWIAPQPLWVLASGGVGVGILVAAAGNVAHEFAHRLNRPGQLFISQSVFALALHASLCVEHVFGHHVNVGTDRDPTTARRGEPFWLFLPRSVIGGYRHAALLEARRAKRRSGAAKFLKNRVLHGYAAMSFLLLAALALGGPAGVAAFIFQALTAMMVIEQLQYISHYGMVRVPGTPVRPCHSWEWSRLASTSYMFNLTRHGDHHQNATKRYWELSPLHASPIHAWSPTLTAIIAMVPPLFFRLTDDRLDHWDRTFATGAERDLARNHGRSNARTRRPASAAT